MRLSTRSRYGIRALAAMAARDSGQATSDSLAAEAAVSKKYLDAILARMRKAGIVEAVRGAGGGYAFARPPGRITCAEVVEAMEGIDLVPCVSCAAACPRSGTCHARDVWLAAARAVRAALTSISIADIARGRDDPRGPTYAI